MSPRGAERGNVGNTRKKRVARTKHWRRGRKGPGGTQVTCKGGELRSVGVLLAQGPGVRPQTQLLTRTSC